MSAEAAMLVYFLYGLSFFTLGLIVLTESLRDPLSGEEPRLNRLLGLFALIHSLREWSELALVWMASSHYPGWEALEWFRVFAHAASFVILAIYGIEALRVSRSSTTALKLIGLFTLPPFLALILADLGSSLLMGRLATLEFVGAVTRLGIAVPSAALAAIGLRAAARRARSEGRRTLARLLDARSFLFSAYSLSQLVGPRVDSLLGRTISGDKFLALVGIPIQFVRTLIAVAMTWLLVREIIEVEGERRRVKEGLDNERLRALEDRDRLRLELLRHSVRTQEEEKARIARELHDEMAQIITGISYDIGALRSKLRGKGDAVPIVERLQDLARRLSKIVYGMLQSLRPEQLEILGLEAALRGLAEREWSPRGLPVELRVTGKAVELEEITATVLYRAAQEALTNVRRHADARAALIELGWEPGRVRLGVADDGAGFDPTATGHGGRRFGLAGIRERAEALGGHFFLSSTPGAGTRVEIVLPLGAERKTP